jgi:hypothetical protein
MTKNEWQTCTDPEVMLEFLGDKASRRKCILFVCACERRMWKHPDCERAKVKATERYADGLASPKEVLATLQDIGIDGVDLDFVEVSMGDDDWTNLESADVAEFAADVVHSKRKKTTDLEDERAWKAAFAAEQAAQCELLRDIFGDRGRLPRIRTAWLTWNNGTVIDLATAIYEARDFERLPVLADALEEAGCMQPAMLQHARGGGVHARGCWLVDRLLGKP